MHVARSLHLVGTVLILSTTTAAAEALDPACRERPTSACVLKAAEQVAQAIPVDSGSLDFRVLAKIYALLGRFDQAVNAADQTDDPDASLTWVAWILADARRFDDALRVARHITMPEWRAMALMNIAEAAIEAGMGQLANRVADEARQVANMSTDTIRFDVPRPMAALLARLGRLDQAMEIAGAISDPARRSRTLRSIVDALVEAGRIDEASRVAGEISDPFFRFTALAEIAGALAGAEQDERADRLFDQAWQSTGSIGADDEARQRSEAQASIVSALAKSGRLARAEVLAGMIGGPLERVRALAHTGAGYALAGQGEQARRLFQQAATASAGSRPGEHLLADIVVVVAGAGAIDEAERLAVTIDHAGARDVTLWQVASAAAAKGRFEQAIRIIAATSDDMRTYPTRDLAAALAQAGAREGRMALVAQALDLAMNPARNRDADPARNRDMDNAHRIAALARIAEALAKAGM